MIQCIAYHVHQWIGEFFDDGPVQFDLLALGLHFDLLTELACEISHQAGHAPE